MDGRRFRTVSLEIFGGGRIYVQQWTSSGRFDDDDDDDMYVFMVTLLKHRSSMKEMPAMWSHVTLMTIA